MPFLARATVALCTPWHVLFWLHYRVNPCKQTSYEIGTAPAMSSMSAGPLPALRGARERRATLAGPMPGPPALAGRSQRQRYPAGGWGYPGCASRTLDAPRPWPSCQVGHAKRICCTMKLVLDMRAGVCYTLVQVRKEGARGSPRAGEAAALSWRARGSTVPARAGRGQ